MIVSHASAILVVARKEVMEHLRSKRLVIIGILYVAFLILGLSLYANVPELRDFGGNGGALDALNALNVVHTGFFGFTFLGVLAIILTADTINGEWKDRTLVLFFTRPMARWAGVTGKLLGALLALYTVALAGAAVGFVGGLVLEGAPDAEGWGRLVGGMGWLLLSLVPLVAFGAFLSAIFRSPTTAFVVGVLMKIIGFPVLTYMAFLFEVGRAGVFGGIQSNFVLVIQHLDPGAAVARTSAIWGRESFGLASALVQSEGEALAWGTAAIFAHLLVYIGVTYWIVGRRDYS